MAVVSEVLPAHRGVTGQHAEALQALLPGPRRVNQARA